LGYGGGRTYEGVNRIDSVLDSRDADFILIMEGANDPGWGVSASTTRANLQIMIEKSIEKSIEPIIATITPNTAAANGYIIPNDYNPAIKLLALEKGIGLADQYAALVGNWANYHSGDEQHLNDTGEQVMAQTWFDAFLNSRSPNSIAPILHLLLE
jgi:lysophospholipase L1-like esterase